MPLRQASFASSGIARDRPLGPVCRARWSSGPPSPLRLRPIKCAHRSPLRFTSSLAANGGFHLEVQRVHEKRILTSLPRSLRRAWRGVMKAAATICQICLWVSSRSALSRRRRVAHYRTTRGWISAPCWISSRASSALIPSFLQKSSPLSRGESIPALTTRELNGADVRLCAMALDTAMI